MSTEPRSGALARMVAARRGSRRGLLRGLLGAMAGLVAGRRPASVAAGRPANQSAPASDPGLIAYVGPDGNIWVTQPDGGRQRPVTTDANSSHSYGRPSWSPDGRMLAFDGFDGYKWTIYLYRAGTSLTPGGAALPATERP